MGTGSLRSSFQPKKGVPLGTGFAVIDVETTGRRPGWHHRVIEIAIVQLDERGHVISEYETLVNPDRDLGPSWLHGIEARDLRNAPRFPEVCGDVARALRDTIVVGHNVAFDVRFLEMEFERANHRIPSLPRVDTIALASEARSDLPNRSLGGVCSCFGIDLSQAHAAIWDARATARLFVECLELLGHDRLRILERYDAEREWPMLPSSTPPYPRSRAAARRAPRESFIASLVERLAPSPGDPPELHAYYATLDQILEDRRVTDEEAEELLEVARMLGLSGEDAIAANTRYLRSLVAVARRDGMLSPGEQRDLQEVAELLGLTSLLPGLIRGTKGPGSRKPLELDPAPNLEGHSVCFTGSLRGVVDGERASRELASSIASDRGMVVKNSVTKKLDFLVAADPDSMSGKASKARQYGVRIVAEPVFWSWMGIDAR